MGRTGAIGNGQLHGRSLPDTNVAQVKKTKTEKYNKTGLLDQGMTVGARGISIYK